MVGGELTVLSRSECTCLCILPSRNGTEKRPKSFPLFLPGGAFSIKYSAGLEPVEVGEFQPSFLLGDF